MRLDNGNGHFIMKNLCGCKYMYIQIAWLFKYPMHNSTHNRIFKNKHTKKTSKFDKIWQNHCKSVHFLKHHKWHSSSQSDTHDIQRQTKSIMLNISFHSFRQHTPEGIQMPGFTSVSTSLSSVNCGSINAHVQ